jgi:uncharacterized membrane protein (DUF373 family)
MKRDYPSLKAHYRFSKEDEEFLLQLRPLMESHVDEFLEGFHQFIWDFGKTAEFLKDEKIITRHRFKLRQWYLDLFNGTYDISYFLKLYKVGKLHAELGLPPYYVNAAFNYVRIFTLSRINQKCCEDEKLTDKLRSVEKIIDMNLDMLTSSYREEEMSRFLTISHIEKKLLGSLKKINSFFNYLLAGALVLVSFFAIGLFLYDIYLFFSGKVGMEKGILTVLGSLLILWASIELINEEIKHLRGAGFALEAFVTLAIAALIRKILIFSLSSEKVMDVLLYGLLVLFLGIVYRLIREKPVVDARK